MNVRSISKRVIALLLSLVMVIGLVPVTALAAGGDTIYVLAGGDYQAGDNGNADHSQSSAHVGAILTQITQKYGTMDGFIFVGDYDGETHGSNGDSYAIAGISSLMDTVDNAYSNLNHSNTILVQGNHENKVEGIDRTGGHEFTGYSVYVLNEDDFPERNPSATFVQATAASLKSWLDNKVSEAYSAPIFIASHVPLAFSTRTNTNGDSQYAKYVFDVLNEAAEDGLNIIFMHGHDHAWGSDNYLGGEAIYLAKGDKINIAVPGSTTEFTEETLNFTYMNAGYVGYYNEDYYNINSYEEDKLTMTVFAITDNQVTVERYSKDGKYNLKSAGREGYYSNAGTVASLGLTYNTTVYESPQTISLGSAFVSSAATNNVYVSIPNAAAPVDDVTPEIKAPQDTGNVADDVTGASNGWVTITEPGDSTEDVTVSESGAWATVVEPGVGTDDVTEEGGSYVTITEPTQGSTTYNYVLDTDGANTGTAYLLANSSGTALYGNGDSLATTTVTINGDTASTDVQDYEWRIDGSSRIYTTINGRTYYLRYDGTLTTSTNAIGGATRWTIANNNGEYTISYDLSWIGSGTYYVTASDVSDTPGTVRLYAYNKDTTTAAPGLYGKIVDEGTDGSADFCFEVANGTSADAVKAMVQGAITVKLATAADYSDEWTLADDNAEGMTWSMEEAYGEGKTPGYYAMTIAYNGVTLGTVQVRVPDTAGLYAAVTGELTETVAIGTSAENAIAALKADITAASSANADGSGETTDITNDLVFTMQEGYDGNVTGDYEVAIKYQGVTIATAKVIVPVTPGVYAIAVGDMSYTMPVRTEDSGETEAAPEALVMDGVTVYTYSGTEAPAADAAPEQIGTEVDDAKVTWTPDPAFNAAALGDYAVDVAYGGKSLATAEVIVVSENTQYVNITGETSYQVPVGAAQEEALEAVKAGVTGWISANADGSEATELNDDQLTFTMQEGYRANTPGDYAVTVSYGNIVLGTVEVIVPHPTHYIAEGPGLYIVTMGTTANGAMADVKEGITVYTTTDDQGSNKSEISDDAITWEWVDSYDSQNVGPYTVAISYNGGTANDETDDVELGNVKVKVKVDYDTGLNDGWTYVGQTEATGGTHTYTLDTDGIDTGSANKYIIVARNAAYLLDAGSAVAITVSSDGKTATTSSRDYEYYFTGRTSGLITRDGTNTLYQQNWGIHTGNISDSNLDRFVNNDNGYYRIYDGDGTQRSLYYDGSKWTVTNDNHTSSTYNVRLYRYTSTTGGTPAGNRYAHLEGADTYHVANGITGAAAMNIVKTGITGKMSYSADGTDATVIPDTDLQWSWKNRFNGNVDGSYWVEIKYNGVTLGTVEVIVEPGVVNDYPEYPHEGAVKVSKTTTGIDFQSSGIAQVEISASGVPSKKGADVVVMLDTSSSMESWCICGIQNCNDHVRRSVVLEESLKDLIAAFKKNGPDGEPLDINVAIADFNGFYSSGAIARDSDDTMADTISYNATSEAKVYTGDKSLNYGAFIPAQNLDETYSLNYTSGTNYDYAFDAIYQLGEASRNSGLDRDLYVIFMSDGAAMQWNYYHSQGQSNTWGEWITGTYEESELAAAVACDTHTYYYNLEDTNGDGLLNEHRMANAVKGDQTEAFEVIRKATGGIDNLTAVTGKNNIYTVPGLGATVFSIAFAPKADGNVEAHYMTTSIETLATKQEQNATQYYYEVNSSDELSNAFSSIGSEIAYAAYNARFVDQMGSSFNLQMTPSEYTVIENGEEEDKIFYPDIQVLTYDIIQPTDVGKTINGKTVTEDMIGQRTGEYNVEETVKFSYSVQQGTNAAGDTINVYTMIGAYSDKIDVDKDGTFGWDANGNFDTADNILGQGDAGYVAGIVYAKTFLYNTTDKNASVTGVQIPTDSGMSNVLPSETFYWKLGTIQSDELAMRYYVYLDGSMEGTKAAGSYQTNEFATLYYDNYLGHACEKDTVSPVIAWKSAKVSYAFYLVNGDGDIIVNQTTGETGTFANKIELTSPVVYEEILLNNLENVSSLNVRAISKDVLPDYYTLYDDTAEYTVTVMSNTSGRWEIKSNSSKKQSTYVMDYNTEDPTAYSNKVETINVQSDDHPDYEYVPGTDYTHTTVWFAVIWSIEAHPDTVVVDYGLPVDISVLSNDMFGDHGHLEAVGPYNEGIEDTVAGKTLADGFLKSDDAPYTGNYGKANVDITTGKVHYVPGTMDWASEGPGYERFAYAVNYTPGDDGENAGYYYDTVTVIPATTVYYEDNFTDVDGSSYITYGKFDKNKNPVTPGWEVEGTAKTDATQAEDRPGYYHLSGVDANNVYGYDGAYTNMSKYSMGSAMKVHVDPSSYATAEFTFYGTGLDIISMTTNTSGVLNMWIKDANGNFVKDGNNNTTNYTVDTYYGYKPTYWAVTYTYNSDSQSWREDVVEVSALGTSGTQPENPSNGATYTVYETRWVPTPDVASSLYQVPVLKAEGLPYGKYTVTLNAAHFEVYDHTTADGYDLYLDAIRIYDPAGTGQQVVDSSVSRDDETVTNVTNVTIKDIYAQDNEGWPTYHELRNMIITAADFNAAQGGDQNTGIIFIDNTRDDPDDGDGVTYTISDYTSYGPNNELYLTTGQSVAFELDLSQYIVNGKNIVADVQIGIKSADSQSGTAYLKVHSAVTNLSKTVTTSTDMYYSIRDMLDLGTDNTGTEPNQDAKTTLVLQNNADQGILSITNIKITLKEAPPAPVETASTFRWSPATGEQAVRMLRAAAPVTPVEPETTVPETTVPETTVPEVTETETTVPEETEPETTVPEETEPEEETPSIQTQITQTVVKIVNTVKNILNSLFGRWM